MGNGRDLAAVLEWWSEELILCTENLHLPCFCEAEMAELEVRGLILFTEVGWAKHKKGSGKLLKENISMWFLQLWCGEGIPNITKTPQQSICIRMILHPYKMLFSCVQKIKSEKTWETEEIFVAYNKVLSTHKNNQLNKKITKDMKRELQKWMPQYIFENMNKLDSNQFQLTIKKWNLYIKKFGTVWKCEWYSIKVDKYLRNLILSHIFGKMWIHVIFWGQIGSL